MKYLLDTCILICMMTDDDRIKESVYDEIFNPGNSLYVSEESIRELFIKKRVNKLDANINVSSELLIKFLASIRINLINYSDDLCDKFLGLPYYKDHKDPSDAFIVSQAILNKLTLVSLDKKFDKYIPAGLKLYQL